MTVICDVEVRKVEKTDVADIPIDLMDLPLHPDEINRIWQHGLHEERLFHDRLNYFSGIQVGLLGVFAILYHKEPSPVLFAPLTAVGLAFALLWLRVQVRHWRYCMHVNHRIKVAVREYAKTIATYTSPGRADGLSIARPLTYTVPLLFAGTWAALFGCVLYRAV
jgi:hypothetical protein